MTCAQTVSPVGSHIRHPGPRDDRGRISLLYIGSEYARSRIVIVGLNARASGGLIVLWKIIAQDIRAAGADRRPDQARFALQVGDLVRLLLERAGEETDLSNAFERMTFLEAVKCGLENSGTGTPPGPMCRNCPPRFLCHELRTLEPLTVVTLGWGAAEPIREALGVTDWRYETARRLEHGDFEHPGGKAHLIGISHPSARHGEWQESCDLPRNLPVSRGAL